MSEDLNGDITASQDLGVDKKKAIESIAVSQNTGASESSVYENLSVYKNQSVASTSDQTLADAPKLQRYMSSSTQNAAAVKDDVSNLSFLEKTGRNISQGWKSSKDISDTSKLYFDLAMKNAYPSIGDTLNGENPDKIKSKIVELENKTKGLVDYTKDDGFQKTISYVTDFAAGFYDTVDNNQKVIGGAAATGAIGGAVSGVGLFSVPASIAGAAAGAATAFPIVMAYDQYKISAGNVVKEYLNGDYGNKLSNEELANAAMVTGAANTALQLFFLKTLKVSLNSTGIGDKASKLAGNYSNNTILNSFITKTGNYAKYSELAKHIATGGLENSVQELTQIMGEEYAKSGGDITLKSMTKDENGNVQKGYGQTIDRLLTAGAAGSTIIATTGGLSILKNSTQERLQRNLVGIKLPDKVVTNSEHTAEVKLDPVVRESILASAQIKNDIEQYTEARKKLTINGTQVDTELHQANIGDGLYYIHPDDVDHIPTEIKKTIEENSGVRLSNVETNQVSMHSIVTSAAEHKSVSDFITVDLNQMSKSKVDRYTTDQVKFGQELPKLYDQLATEKDPAKVTEIKSQISTIQDQAKASHEYFIPKDKPVFPIKLNLPEVTELQSSIKDSNKELKLKAITQSQDIISLDKEIDRVQRSEKLNTNINANPDIQLSLLFQNDFNLSLNPKLGEAVNNVYPAGEYKYNEKGSALAIDPSTLPENLKHLTKDKDVTKHRIFQPGGLAYDQYDTIANAMGFKDTVALFDKLRESKTRKELVKSINDEKNINIIKTTEDIKAKKTDELRPFIRNAQLAGEHIKLATNDSSNIPDLKSLQVTAKELASNITYVESDPLVYLNNADTHAHKANIDLEANNIPSYLSRKTEQMTNTLIAGEVTHTRNIINDNIKQIAKMTTEANAEILQKSPEHSSVINSLMSVIDFNPRKGILDTQQIFDQLEALRDGGTVIIGGDPESLGSSKVGINGLTLSQAEATTTLIRNVFEDAKRKNQLLAKSIADRETKLVTSATQDIAFEQKSKKTFSEDRIKNSNFQNPKMDMFSTIVGTLGTHSRIAQYLGSSYEKYIYNPLVQLQMDKLQTAKKVNEVLKESSLLVDGFNKMNLETVDVPELRNKFRDEGIIKKTSVITKANIYQILKNFGHSEGRKWIEHSFGINEEAQRAIIEKHLTPAHLDAAIKESTIFSEIFNPMRKDLMKRTNQIGAPDVELGKVTLFNKEVPEWFYPIKTEESFNNSLSKGITDQKEDVASILDQGKLSDYNSKISEKVNFTNNIKRKGVGEGRILSLDSRVTETAASEITHALHATEPMSDIFKILSSPDVQSSIIGSIGSKGFKDGVVGSVIATARDSKNDVVYQNQGIKIIQKAMNNFSLSRIAYRASSVGKQLGSIPIMSTHLNNVGNNGGKYVLSGLASVSDMNTFNETFNKIAQISPEFAEKHQSAVENLSQLTQKIGEKMFGDTDTYNQRDAFYKEVFKNSKDFGLGYITSISAMLNTAQFHAAYSQAMNGDAHGIAANDHGAAVLHAEKAVRASLEANTVVDTPSAMRDPLFKSVSGMFISQANTLFNQTLFGIADFKDSRSKEQAWKAAKTVLNSSLVEGMLATAAGAAFYNIGGAVIGDDKRRDLVESPSDIALNGLFGNTALARDFVQIYKSRNYKGSKSYPSPFIQTADDLNTVLGAISSKLADGADFRTQDSKAAASLAMTFSGLPSAVFQNLTQDLVQDLSQFEGFTFKDPISTEVMNAAMDNVKNSTTATDTNKEAAEVLRRRFLLKDQFDNPESSIVKTDKSSVYIKPDMYGLVKLTNAVSNDYHKNQYGSEIDKDVYAHMVSTYTRMKLPENINELTLDQLTAVNWKISAESMEMLKKHNIDVSPEMLYLRQIFGDNYESFLTADNVTKIKDMTKYNFPENMTKYDLIERVQKDMSDQMDTTIKRVKK